MPHQIGGASIDPVAGLARAYSVVYSYIKIFRYIILYSIMHACMQSRACGALRCVSPLKRVVTVIPTHHCLPCTMGQRSPKFHANRSRISTPSPSWYTTQADSQLPANTCMSGVPRAGGSTYTAPIGMKLGGSLPLCIWNTMMCRYHGYVSCEWRYCPRGTARARRRAFLDKIRRPATYNSATRGRTGTIWL